MTEPLEIIIREAILKRHQQVTACQLARSAKTFNDSSPLSNESDFTICDVFKFFSRAPTDREKFWEMSTIKN